MGGIIFWALKYNGYNIVLDDTYNNLLTKTNIMKYYSCGIHGSDKDNKNKINMTQSRRLPTLTFK